MAYSPCLRLHARLRTVHQPKNHQTLHYERSKQEMNVKPSTTFDPMILSYLRITYLEHLYNLLQKKKLKKKIFNSNEVVFIKSRL